MKLNLVKAVVALCCAALMSGVLVADPEANPKEARKQARIAAEQRRAQREKERDIKREVNHERRGPRQDGKGPKFEGKDKGPRPERGPKHGDKGPKFKGKDKGPRPERGPKQGGKGPKFDGQKRGPMQHDRGQMMAKGKWSRGFRNGGAQGMRGNWNRPIVIVVPMPQRGGFGGPRMGGRGQCECPTKCPMMGMNRRGGWDCPMKGFSRGNCSKEPGMCRGFGNRGGRPHMRGHGERRKFDDFGGRRHGYRRGHGRRNH